MFELSSCVDSEALRKAFKSLFFWLWLLHIMLLWQEYPVDVINLEMLINLVGVSIAVYSAVVAFFLDELKNL